MSITYSITGTSEKVTFNAEGFYNNPSLFDVGNSSVTSETITSSGASMNSITLSNSGRAVSALIINGDTSFNATGIVASFVSHLNSINASTDTGGVTIDTSLGTLKPTFTFTGGTGTDWLTVNKASLDVLNAGTQLNGGTAISGNVLAVTGIGTITGTSASTGEYKILNATKGFQILGVGVPGNSVVINDAFLTNGFATHISDGQNGGSLTVINVGKTFTLDISDANADNPTPTNVTIGSAASTNSALTVNLTPNSAGATLLDGLTEGTLTTTGGTITTVNLISNAATSGNTLNTYHGADKQILTITGNNALTIGSITPDIKTGDTINASKFTQALTLGSAGATNAVATAAGDTGKGDVILLGSGKSYLAVSSAAIGDKITLLAGHTAVDTIDTTLISSVIAAIPFSSAAAQQADITQITNFNTKSDILKVGIFGNTAPHIGTASDLTGHAWSVTNGFVSKTGLTGATGLTAFLADVASSKTFTANDVLAYTDGTNTYIATADHAAGTALGENIIELVSVHTPAALSNAGGASMINIAGLMPAVVGMTFTLKPNVDTCIGGAGNDTFNANPVPGNDITLTANDYIDGGAGINTLNVVQKSTPISIPTTATIKNIQTANLTSASTVFGDVSGWTGLRTLNVNEVGGTKQYSSGITAAGTTDVTLIDSALGWNNSITVNGGHNVTLTAFGVSQSRISVGGDSAPTGTINIIDNMVFSDTNNLSQNSMRVNGGTIVNVTETSGAASALLHNTNYTVSQAEVAIYGTASTTTVTVTQDAAVTKVDGMSGNVGVTDGHVYIYDVNYNSPSIPASITTVTLNNFNGGADVRSSVLQTLNLSGTGGSMDIHYITSLGINLNGLNDTDSIYLYSVQNLNLDSSTAPSIINYLNDSNVTTLNITGNAHFTLSRDVNYATNEVITVTNTAGVTLGSIATPLSNSSLTINLATNISAPQTVFFHGIQTINQASGANTGLLTINENNYGGGVVLSFATTGNQSRYISLAGSSDIVTLTGGGSGNSYVGGSLDAMTHTPTSATGGNDTFTLNGSGNDNLWIGHDSTININGSGNDNIWIGYSSTLNIGSTFSGTANIKLTGDYYNSGGLITVNGLPAQIAHRAGATVALDFTDPALTGGVKLAGSTFAGSIVDETGVTYLGAALDRAASYNSPINAHSGVIDWFQFNGDTYIVESENTGSSPITLTGLGGHDIAVKLTGLVDLSTAHFSAGVVTPLYIH